MLSISLPKGSYFVSGDDSAVAVAQAHDVAVAVVEGVVGFGAAGGQVVGDGEQAADAAAEAWAPGVAAMSCFWLPTTTNSASRFQRS